MKVIPPVLSAAAAAAIAAAAIASAASGPVSPPAGRTLSLAVKPTAFGQGDVGKKGPTPADTQAFEDPISEGGKRVGTAYIAGILTDKHGQLVTDGTLKLKDGDVSLAGLSGTRHRFTLAIVGGTGAFSGARGVAKVIDRDTSASTIELDFAS